MKAARAGSASSSDAKLRTSRYVGRTKPARGAGRWEGRGSTRELRRLTERAELLVEASLPSHHPQQLSSPSEQRYSSRRRTGPW